MPRLRPLQLHRDPAAIGISTVEQVELFARWHITDIRRNKRGELTRVKHATEGWLALEEYVERQHQHEILVATIPKFIEGGYRMKEALWNAKFEIAGFSLPLGSSIPAVGTAWAVADGIKAADPTNRNRLADGLNAARDVADLVLPFGDVDLMIRMANAAVGLPSQINNIIGPGSSNVEGTGAADIVVYIFGGGWAYDLINGPGAWQKRINDTRKQRPP